MDDRKAAAIETQRLRKAFRETLEGKEYYAIASALYKAALTDGIVGYHRRMQSSWEPLNRAYRQRKNRQGYSIQTWVRSGRTLNSLRDNAPNDEGRVRRGQGLLFKIDPRRDKAAARPNVFFGDAPASEGKAKKGPNRPKLVRLDSKRQVQVMNVLRYGGSTWKIRRTYGKKQRKESFGEYLSASYGPGKKARKAALAGKKGVPSRPLMGWTPEIVARAEVDVARKLEQLIGRKSGAGAA